MMPTLSHWNLSIKIGDGPFLHHDMLPDLNLFLRGH
jgi:hypothetical protein